MSNTKCRISNSNKTIFLIFIKITFLFASLSANPANALPTAKDINKLEQTARLYIDTFMQESFELRMKYEYSDEFLSQSDRETLQKIAKRASNQLQRVAETQQLLKNEIENYQGQNWDNKYGETGLWRELSKKLYTTVMNKSEVDFYLALTSKQPQKNNILHRILTEINSLNLAQFSANCQLLKAKTMALLSQTNTIYRSSAQEEFDMLIVRSDIRQTIAFRTAIERIKFFGQTEVNQLEKLTEELMQSRCANDPELVLLLAFLQRRLNHTEAFEKMVHNQPQLEDILSSLALYELSNYIAQGRLTKQNLSQISVFEIELAILAAWKNQPHDYEILLGSLSSIEKFQTPLILYVTAIAFAESSPAKAVTLLTKASRLQKSDKLSTEAGKIARQASQLAYNLFAQDQINCQLALQTFENYIAIAEKQIDEELEYLYTVILNNCNQEKKGAELLEKIASRPTGKWRNRAKLEQIIKKIQQGDLNEKQYSVILQQLNSLIANCSEPKEQLIQTEAINIYCQLLFESKDKDCDRKVLEILTEAKTNHDPNLNLFKSKALRQSGRLEPAIDCLLEAIKHKSCKYNEETMELLRQIIDKIDQLQVDNPNFLKIVQDCEKLSLDLYNCPNGHQQILAKLFYSEFCVFNANEYPGALSKIEKILDTIADSDHADNVDFLRCRARLIAKQNKFGESAKLWAQIAKIRKYKAPEDFAKSWKWWRAKFYELNYLAKAPQGQKRNIAHTIDVLENSFTDIPPLWAENLSQLKERCYNQVLDSGK